MPGQIGVRTLVLTRLTDTHAYLPLSTQPGLSIHPFWIAADLSARQVVQRPLRDYCLFTRVPRFVRLAPRGKCQLHNVVLTQISGD